MPRRAGARCSQADLGLGARDQWGRAREDYWGRAPRHVYSIKSEIRLGVVGGVHVEVNFGSEPFVALLAEEGGDEAPQQGFVGEEGGDAGAAFQLLIDALDGDASAPAPLMGAGEGLNGETLREVLLHPSSQCGGGFGIAGDALFESSLGGKEIRRLEDGATEAQRNWPARRSLVSL